MRLRLWLRRSKNEPATDRLDLRHRDMHKVSIHVFRRDFLSGLFFFGLAIAQVEKLSNIERGMRIFAIVSFTALVIGVLLPDPEILKCLLEQW